MGLKSLIGALAMRLDAFVGSCVEMRMNERLRDSGSKGRVTRLVDIRHPENVRIGRGSYVNGGMLAASPNARIVIGENCMISYGVHLRTDMHRHSRTDVPMCEQGYDEADIVIGDDVWIGYGAQVMSGVTVGGGSIVAAGAVVTHDVPPGTIVAGVPSRVIGWRAGNESL